MKIIAVVFISNKISEPLQGILLEKKTNKKWS